MKVGNYREGRKGLIICEERMKVRNYGEGKKGKEEQNTKKE